MSCLGTAWHNQQPSCHQTTALTSWAPPTRGVCCNSAFLVVFSAVQCSRHTVFIRSRELSPGCMMQWIGLLAVATVAVVLLSSRGAEGRHITRCELKRSLDEALMLNPGWQKFENIMLARGETIRSRLWPWPRLLPQQTSGKYVAEESMVMNPKVILSYPK